ncbi:MAG: bifunctional precorrin-2 dehydrogenase/sirohydrochlorin ferrochelatase [Deltaproteobacteria bacterium]|nr:MAG: bifunctional precorrin-2 dehydrogenase/sirohydrochlorin ferrochelatase [Deltaproteobacteria bacterium]
MRYYPIFLKVENRNCLVVGGGEVGARKVKTLLSCGASVALVSPEVVEWLEEKIQEGAVDLVGKYYEEKQLEGCSLVIAATDDLELNSRIARDAEERGLLCNVVDYPQEGNFILPALIQRGALTLAISTAGKSPALARQIREDLEQRFGMEYANFLDIMGAVRSRLLKESQDSRANKEKFDGLVKSELLELVRRGDLAAVDNLLQTVMGPGYSLKELEISW